MKNLMDSSQVSATVKYWVELYSDNLYSWAFYKTSSKETAEDLVQETFLAAVYSFEKYKGESNPRTWLFAILNNKINDHYRSSYRQRRADEDLIFEATFDVNNGDHWKAGEIPQPWSDETEHLLDDTEFQKILHRCLKKLPGNWFAAIQLKFMEEKNSQHICQELRISNTNFWQILHRAKLQLRKCLELNWFKK